MSNQAQTPRYNDNDRGQIKPKPQDTVTKNDDNDRGQVKPKPQDTVTMRQGQRTNQALTPRYNDNEDNDKGQIN